MTVVNLTALETLLDAPGDIERGYVDATYWAGPGPYIGVDGDDVTFSPTIRVAITDGAPVVPLDMVPTAGLCCVKWRIGSLNGGFVLTRFTSIPDTGPVDFGDLPVVNPHTFAPASNPTIVDTIRTELLDGHRLEVVTQAEYDLIPIPRPDDVLYVITP